MKIKIPEFCLVLLIGPSGCGKSTFARQHFKPTEILSSDGFRAMLSDDENNQAATADAFRILHEVLEIRLSHKHLTVIDATNVQEHARRSLISAARRTFAQVVAIVFALPESVCWERSAARTDRRIPPENLRQQLDDLHENLPRLKAEKFDYIYTFNSVEELDEVEIVRKRLPVNHREKHGPFDIIGDVHGCYDELVELLTKLGYQVHEGGGQYGIHVKPPEGHTLVFVGDLVDRGPKIAKVLKLAMGMVEQGAALSVPGNHDDKLMRALKGRNVKIAHGLDKSLEQLQGSRDFRDAVCRFIEGLPSHLVLDGGKLVVAHAGVKQMMQGRNTPSIRDFAMYGETTGKVDQYGLPERINWAKDYRGRAMVVYGHTPIPRHEWINNTINIDTGCVFGGGLTALCYPELQLVSVLAKQEYAVSARPFLLELDADLSTVRPSPRNEDDQEDATVQPPPDF